MQLFTSLGKPWDLSVKPLCKILLARFPVEFVTLFTFIFVAQRFIDESSFSIVIYVIWTAIMYLTYLIRSYCNSDQFNTQLNLDIDEIVDLFHQLPNCNLFQNFLFTNSQSSTEWINCFLAMFWPKFSIYFNKKYKRHSFELIRFFALENVSLGFNAPLVESLSSSLISHNHEDTLMLNFNLYWFAKSYDISKPSQSKGDQQLLCLKLFRYSIGSLLSFCFKANCQIRFRFMQWQMNEDIQLRDIQFSFTHPPKFHHLHTSGFLWLLDNLQLVRPVMYMYLNQRFLYPKRALFKNTFNASTTIESRRPRIGCPVALFCIDVIQAENVPMIKKRKVDQANEAPTAMTVDGVATDAIKRKSKPKLISRFDPLPQRMEEMDEDTMGLSSNMSNSKRCLLLNCFSYRLPSVFCNVQIFNQHFTSSHIPNSVNPFWNFRSFVPIFSHSKHTIEQLEKYHSLFSKSQEQNPIDLNASFYQFHETNFATGVSNFKQFISYDLLENVSIHIQLMDKQDNNQNRMIAEFQIVDPSQYFLDAEFNGQSMWINSASNGVVANVDQTVKLNVRFTFLTLNQTLNSIILSNAYLANRLAFPIGVMLVFVDAAIGLNMESLRGNLNAIDSNEYGFQIVCKLGTQTLSTSICTDLSFIWENELLFCVYSLSLEKMVIKLIARSLNTNKFDLSVIATSKLDLSGLLHQPTLTMQHYVPLVLKSNPSVQLKLLLSFRIIHFTTKLTTNCLRNAKVAEEDVLVREKQIYFEDKMKSSAISRQSIKEEDISLKDRIDIEKRGQEDTEYVEPLEHDSNEDMDTSSAILVEPIGDTAKSRTTAENVHIFVSARMRWPKIGKFVIEIVDLRCAKFLTLFQMYAVDMYLSCTLREREKVIQTKRTKNFQLKTSTVPINQELKFNCITKPLSAYHLNISLHEKRTEGYNKVAELYTALPSLILASGQIDKQLVLSLTPLYLTTSGFNEVPFSPNEFEFDPMEISKVENEPK